MVTRCQLTVGFAHPVAGAVVGAGCSLARRSLVTHEAGARGCCSVAQALVGALHVEVRGVVNRGPVSLFYSVRFLTEQEGAKKGGWNKLAAAASQERDDTKHLEKVFVGRLQAVPLPLFSNV